MKILLITDDHLSDKRGAEKCFFTLKNALKKNPELSIFSFGFGEKNKIGEDYIVFKQTSHKLLKHIWQLFINPVKYFQIRSLIKQFNPDVIHIHNIKKYTPTLLKALRGYPTVQTVHDFGLICPTHWNVHQDLRPCTNRFSLRCAFKHRRHYRWFSFVILLCEFYCNRVLLKKYVKKIIVPSPCLQEYFQLNGFNNVELLPHFKNTQSQPISKESNHTQFLFLGSLEQQKGVRVLIHEFHHAFKKNNHIYLKIAGTGIEEAYLKQKVQEWGLENHVQFLGWVEQPELLYKECTAVIFPSIGLEAFGLVITEAMSYARPVIGSNRGPTPWLVENDKTGLLFDPLTEGDLAKALLKIADNPELAKNLGQHGFEKLQAFPENHQLLDKIMGIYKKACYPEGHLASVQG